MMELEKLFARFSSVKTAVVGDIMLDTYWWGKVERISPEAPVPVVSIQRKEQRIGGASNVALNTEAMLAPTTVFSVTGNDNDADLLEGLLATNKIQTGYIQRDPSRPTTNKIRIMGRSQQMMRLDNETVNPLSPKLETVLLDAFWGYVKKEKPSVVILEDYNKGVLTEKVIDTVISISKEAGAIVTVDPKKKNFFAYKGVDIFKPNLKEVFEALHLTEAQPDLDTLSTIHKSLQQQLQHHASLITLSEKGIFFQENDQPATILPAWLRDIADVSGAGDTVISVASLVYALTRDLQTSAAIANIAGGLVCEELGTATIHRDLLLQECRKLLK